MNTFHKILMLLCLTVILATFPAQAQPECAGHPYLCGPHWSDFGALASDMQSIMGVVMTPTAGPFAGCNLWVGACGHAPLWQSVSGQAGPGWVNTDQGAGRSPWAYSGTGIRDDHHFALLGAVLHPSACIDGIPAARVQAIRNAFAANRAAIFNQEMTINQVRVRASASFVNLDTRVDIVTGQRACINTGIPGLGTQCFDVPPMWRGNSSLLGGVHPRLRDALVNLNAAYMTIGDSRYEAYWYAFMGRLALTFVNELLPGLIANMKEDSEVALSPGSVDFGEAVWRAALGGLGASLAGAAGEGDDKAACSPWGNVPDLDVTVSGVPVVGSVRISLEDWRVCQTIRGFADQFQCNRFNCGNAIALASRTNQGDLNDDGTYNLASYQAAGGDLATFLVRENARTPSPLIIVSQPSGPALPLGGSTYTFTVGMEYTRFSYNYTWYSGITPGNLFPVVPAVNSPIFEAANVPEGMSYYRVEVSHPCGGSVQSDPASLNRIPIVITKQPPEQSYVTVDTSDTLTGLAAAEIVDETPVRYQWYRKVGSDVAFEPYGDAGPSSDLHFPLAEPGDSGYYFCRITSVDHGHSVDTDIMYLFVTGASVRIYDALSGLGPQGSLVQDSGSIAINTNVPSMTLPGPVTVFGEMNAGVAVYRFNEVHVGPGVAVTVSGANPLSITAAGDLTWEADIVVAPGTLGGGAGGSAGTATNTGGFGGSGSTVGGGGGSPAQGGQGGQPHGPGINGAERNAGSEGGAGVSGDPGGAGHPGGAGGTGFGARGHGGVSGTSGHAGSAGQFGGTGGQGRSGGGGAGQGSSGAYQANTHAGGNGGGGQAGGVGGTGGVGGDGGTGGHGGHGSFQARADDLVLAAGHGGGGGGGGGRGGGGRGGGAGGGGSSGGGGGGAGGINVGNPDYPCYSQTAHGQAGASSGAGGTGGSGGVGGSSNPAGHGGAGGFGGGAVAFAARGMLRHVGTVDVSAGPRSFGASGAVAVGGAPGNNGGGGAGGSSAEFLLRRAYREAWVGISGCTSTNWWAGQDPAVWWINEGRGGHGGAGGGGGRGGDGGASGASGGGGDGGYGTPGMVKAMGTVAMTDSAAVQAYNSQSNDPEHSARFTLISNMKSDVVALNKPVFDGSVVWGSCDNEALLQGQNPYAGGLTAMIGEMASGRAATRGWLREAFWNESSVAYEDRGHGLAFGVLRGEDSVFEGFDQVFVKNTLDTEALSGIAVKAGTRPGLLINGLGGIAGVLEPGQVWTTTALAQMEVKAGFAPAIAPVADMNATDAQVYSFTPSLAAGDVPVVWSLVAPEFPPDDMTIDAATGEITWTASYTVGTVPVTVRAQNDFGADTESWVVTVQAVPPTLLPLADAFVADGALWGVQPQMDGYATTPISWDLVAPDPDPAPADMQFSVETGALVWQADHALSPVTFIIQADGPGGADVTAVTVEVASPLSFETLPDTVHQYVDSEPQIVLEALINGGFAPQQYYWERRNRVTGNVQTVDAGPVTGKDLSLYLDPVQMGVGDFEFTLTVVDLTGIDDGWYVRSSPETRVQLADRLSVVEDLVDAVVTQGDTFRWSVEIAGGIGALDYQWRRFQAAEKSFVPISNGPLHGGVISGAQTDTLVFQNFVEEFAGAYDVVIADSFEDSLTAGPATLDFEYAVPAGGMALLGLVLALGALAGATMFLKKHDE